MKYSDIINEKKKESKDNPPFKVNDYVIDKSKDIYGYEGTVTDMTFDDTKAGSSDWSVKVKIKKSSRKDAIGKILLFSASTLKKGK